MSISIEVSCHPLVTPTKRMWCYFSKWTITFRTQSSTQWLTSGKVSKFYSILFFSIRITKNWYKHNIKNETPYVVLSQLTCTARIPTSLLIRNNVHKCEEELLSFIFTWFLNNGNAVVIRMIWDRLSSEQTTGKSGGRTYKTQTIMFTDRASTFTKI